MWLRFLLNYVQVNVEVFYSYIVFLGKKTRIFVDVSMKYT